MRRTRGSISDEKRTISGLTAAAARGTAKGEAAARPRTVRLEKRLECGVELDMVREA